MEPPWLATVRRLLLKASSHGGCGGVPPSPRSAPHQLVCLHAHYWCPTLLVSHASLIINLEASHLLYRFCFFTALGSQWQQKKDRQERTEQRNTRNILNWILPPKYRWRKTPEQMGRDGDVKGAMRFCVLLGCRGSCIFNGTCRHSHDPVCLMFSSLALRLASCFPSGILDKRKIMPLNTQTQWLSTEMSSGNCSLTDTKENGDTKSYCTCILMSDRHSSDSCWFSLTWWQKKRGQLLQQHFNMMIVIITIIIIIIIIIVIIIINNNNGVGGVGWNDVDTGSVTVRWARVNYLEIFFLLFSDLYNNVCWTVWFTW